jgi:uncharacterized membrane protein YfcA
VAKVDGAALGLARVPTDFLPLFAIGLVAGAIGALLGVGGGLLIVPALALWGGLHLRVAVSASLVCICATSVSSSVIHLRRHRVDLPSAIELQFYAVIGAVLSGLSAGLIPAGPLFLVFAGFLLLMAGQMWPSHRKGMVERLLERSQWSRVRVARGVSVGAGIVSGLLGVGGGILNTPLLHLVMGVPFDRAVATSAYMIGMTAAAGALVYYARGDVVASAATAAMLGTLVGAVPAALAGHRIGARWLRMSFAALLATIAALMLRRGLTEL